MMMMYKVPALVLIIVICSLADGEPIRQTCVNLRCNETDPNCEETGVCKHIYRTCCDGACTKKTIPCDSGPKLSNYAQIASSANASEYSRLLEEAKEMILNYVSNRTCWPDEYCANATTCKPQYKKCSDGKRCVNLLSECGMFWETITYEMDRNVTCYPAERCFRNNCHMNFWMCDNGECVHESVLCQNGHYCDDGSDDKYCEGDCFPPDRCRNGACKNGYFACGNGKCILQDHVCDTTKDCMDGSDEQNCTAACWPIKWCLPDGKCKPGYFGCDNGKCIDNSNVCDMRQNCEDGTDEVRTGHGFKCILGNNFDTCVLPQDQVHDNVTRCEDHADNCVMNQTNRCFQCMDGRLTIADKQRCNGVVDCYDLSDECFCDEDTIGDVCSSVCLHINSDHCRLRQPHVIVGQVEGSIPVSCACKPGQFDCGNGICLNVSQVCDGIPDCGSNGKDEIYCEKEDMKAKQTVLCPGDVRNTSLVEAVLCDGRAECYNLADECDERCNVTAPFCNIRSRFHSDDGPYEFLCDHLALFFNAKEICDGRWSPCFPRIDEEELGCPARHYCKSEDAISIDINLMCDGVPQCDDASDEANCTGRFYCDSGMPYSVPMNKKRNGKVDCSDGSDECPREMDDDILSSRKELVGAIGFRVVTWILAFLGLTGNLVTFVGACKALFCNGRVNNIARINYLLLLNLSLADGFMGIYLVALSVKGFSLSGEYCRFDRIWRTSEMCSNLGSLALVSSEVSVIILVYLSTLRLLSIACPIATKNSSMKLPTIAVGVAWLVGTLLAVLPRAASLADYFVSEIWIPNKLNLRDVMDKFNTIILVERLSVLGPTPALPPQSLSWYEMAEYLKNVYDIDVKGYFGYYSDNSVCLPRFFAAMGDAGWGYSTGVIVFNFAAFCYVCAAYWAIFRLTSGEQASKQKAKQLRKMHGRISRLVLTDFICWVPICLMSFIKLGGVDLPDSAYAFTAVILLPVNSAVNPLLYSDITLKALFSGGPAPASLQNKAVDAASQKAGYRKTSRITALSLEIFGSKSDNENSVEANSKETAETERSGISCG